MWQSLFPCTAIPRCIKDQTNYCGTYNRFLSEKWEPFNTQTERQASLSVVIANTKHECFMRFCNICNKKQRSGHSCHVAPLKTRDAGYVIVSFLRYRVHTRPWNNVPNLISDQQMCSKYGAVDDWNIDCDQCGNRIHMFWQKRVGKFINYLRQSRPFADTI